MVKLYAALWTLFFFVAGALALTGNFTTRTTVVFGFISFGMIFMGMMSVLPSMVSTPEGRKSLSESKSDRGGKDAIVPGRLQSPVYEWLFQRGTEVSQPTHEHGIRRV